MVRRAELLKLALMGMAAAATLGGALEAAAPISEQGPGQMSGAPGGMTTRQQAFYGLLNPKMQAVYLGLDTDARELAIQVFNAPPGKNLCAGLNACVVPGKNDCKGKGSCKNSTQDVFTDPNDAVQVVAAKMKGKRASMGGY